ncbi:endonuclease NucS domain-containing protein [Caballeronia grimmiae]|uniref:endonuclease NucS domain-containing protein n=1 Tax=Caballeronia grimmiae TaxID=1071679 RepID=UPI0038BB8AC8
MSDDYAIESGEKPPLERDVQLYLANSLSSSLGEKLTLVQTEFILPIGRIDILAVDELKRFVAIELKYGAAGRDAVGQLQSYMGALMQANPDTFARGILVASSLDAKAEAALLVARDIEFVSFQLAFKFEHKRKGNSSYEDWVEKRKRRTPSSSTPKIWLPVNFKTSRS